MHLEQHYTFSLFSINMAEIERKHNEEYLKKRKVIQERMDKINEKKAA